MTSSGIEELPLYRFRLLRPLPSRALPKIRIPRHPRATKQLVKTEDPDRASARYVTNKEIHSMKGLEWIKATEKGWQRHP